MNIEKCSIKRTETRTREMVASRAAIASVDAGECRHLHVYAPGEINDNGSEPVTLTYPAPVQVEGFRLECSFDEAAPGAILAAIEQIMHENGRTICGRWVAVDDSASPPTQPAPQDAGERGDEAEMRRRGWEWDGHAKWWAKIIGERKCIVWYDHTDSTWNANKGMDHIGSYLTQTAAADNSETYTPKPAQPAPIVEASERVPYTMETWPGKVKVRMMGVNTDGSWVLQACGDRVIYGYAGHPRSKTYAELAADYELSTDNGATWQPCWQTKRAATLPWHDLGPGLSVAVVEGKGLYIARHDPRCGVAYFLKNNGGYVDIDQPPTLAAAKAACDAHAKGGGA